LNQTDTQMIRRTEVRMTRAPGMPCYSFACPFCGAKANPMRDGEHECKGCGAMLQAVKPRK